jgi:hypothetical protein
LTLGEQDLYVAVGDFNGDGIADLAVGGSNVNVLLGNGDGTFTAKAGAVSSATVGGFLAVGDFNGDGIADLAVANTIDNTVTILLGNGDGTFTTGAASPPATTPGAIVVGDFSGSGISDLVVSDPCSWYTYQESPDCGSLTVLMAQPQTATAPPIGISLPVDSGTHLAEASYPGDNNYGPSVSATTALYLPASLSMSASSMSFGSKPVGYTTASQNVTLTNLGSGEVTISRIVLSGANPSSFAYWGSCGASVAAGASCTIGAHFVPTVTGTLTAVITLTDNAVGSPQTITLSGTGTTAPAASLSLSASSLSFGSEAVGGTTASQDVTLTNTSGAVLYFKSIALTGANAASFAIWGNCGFSLAAGAKCTIGAHFVPKATGALTAAITLTDNASGSPQSIALTGTGQ